MRGFVLINAYPNGEKFYRQAERIAEELRELGVETDVVKNGQILSVVNADGGICIKGAKEYDFCVYLDKDKYLGKALETSDLRLFNPAKAVEICDDKVSTYLALSKAGVRLAKIIPAPLCYTPNTTPNQDFLEKVVKELTFPVVVKKSYGSFGAGVLLARNMQELQAAAQEYLYVPHFYQEYVAESSGRDVRVIVVGGRAIAAMERVAQAGEFRSNVELGGVGKKIALSAEYAATAERAAKALGLDYCGVDLLESAQGAVVCEVNSNAFFEGLEKTTGINVARAYAEYIVDNFSAKKL